ncbi:MAG: SDR family NAD(P)-dependent oxidoreductase, partial [Bdellovibrionota bacterium]
EWHRVWNLNFLTHADLTTKFAPLLASNKGSIVSVSSIVGQHRLPAPSAYSSAKAALDNFCLYASAQLASRGVRFNAVAPGNIMSDRWAERMKTDKAAMEKYINESVPMKRLASVEEVANAVVFLASPAAAFCTGSVLRVDGGQSASI